MRYKEESHRTVEMFYTTHVAAYVLGDKDAATGSSTVE